MDGCSGFPPDSQTASIKQYSVGLRRIFQGNPAWGGGRLKHTKSCSNPTNRVAAAVFPQQKSHRSVLADPCVFPHLSSSPDLRLISSAWPSQISPMTGFRRMQNLHAYSGGTVRDSHPVFYSLVVLLPHPQALKRNIYFRGEYTPTFEKSQPKNGIIAVKIVSLFLTICDGDCLINRNL